MVVTGVQADLTMVQDYVDQQCKIIHVRTIKYPLSCSSKLLNNDAIALWIRHRTVIFTDTKIIINEIHRASNSFFSILLFVVYFLTIGPIILIIISTIGTHKSVTNIDFHKHLPYLTSIEMHRS